MTTCNRVQKQRLTPGDANARTPADHNPLPAPSSGRPPRGGPSQTPASPETSRPAATAPHNIPDAYATCSRFHARTCVGSSHSPAHCGTAEPSAARVDHPPAQPNPILQNHVQTLNVSCKLCKLPNICCLVRLTNPCCLFDLVSPWSHTPDHQTLPPNQPASG